MGVAIAGCVSASTAFAQSSTIAGLEARIRELQAQLQTLLDQAQGGPSALHGFQFARSLYRGLNDASTGGEVSKLQEYLREDASIYPQGIVSGYYGALTEAAVRRLQVELGLPQVGIFGPRTREAVNNRLRVPRVEGPPLPSAATFSLSTIPTLQLVRPLTGAASVTTAIQLTVIEPATSPINLSVRGLPPYATLAPLPACASSCTIQSTLHIQANTPVGTSTVSIIATDGTHTATSTFTLAITTPAPFQFSLTAPQTITLTKRFSGSVSATATISTTLLAGSAESVSFSASGYPSGVSVNLPPACLPSCSGTVTFSASSGAAQGTSTVQILGRSRNHTSTSSLTLFMLPPQSFRFSLGASPDLSLVQPTYGRVSATNTISVAAIEGVPERITFTQSGLPRGATIASVPQCVSSPCTVTNTLSIDPTTPPGIHAITVTARADRGSTEITTYTLTVADAVPFRFSLNNSGNITLARPTYGNASSAHTVSATLIQGTAHPVSFSQSGFPSGTSGSGLSQCTPPCSRTNTVTISPSTAVGVYPITVSTTGGGNTATTNYTLEVTEAVPFAIELETSDDVRITRPSSGTASASNEITLRHMSGYSQTMSFSQRGFPSGAGASSPSSCAPTCGGTNIVTVSANTSLGTYPIELVASGGGITASTTYQLIVE